MNSSGHGHLHKNKPAKIPTWQGKKHKTPAFAEYCVWRSEDNLKELFVVGAWQPGEEKQETARWSVSLSVYYFTTPVLWHPLPISLPVQSF